MNQHRKQCRAQKAYVCDMCFCEINKGSQHIRLVKEADGRLNEQRLHIHCDALLGNCPEPVEKDFAPVARWISRKVCDDCGIGECEGNPFACGKVIEALVPPALRGAAQDSIRQSEAWI
ncbi:MAG: hypothetical protein IJ466_07220 [Clostridia bacterium]|nr:hypothetical protein [Clostridia bacterium]